MHDRPSIKPSILVTGCAGFIGARTAELFLADGQSVVGIEDLNDYYDVRLKQHGYSDWKVIQRFVCGR